MAGEAKRKKKKLAAMVASERRCIYCANAPTTVEHMPPISLFKKRAWPQGMEFAACKECNQGTRGADLVASFFARLSRVGEKEIVAEAIDRKWMLSRQAPGVLEELFRPDKERTLWLTQSGIRQPYVHITADGPLTKAYLTVFTAKFGMALYREHIGEALPIDGGVHTQWFLNAGLAAQAAEAMLKIMPSFGTLQQGNFTVPEQFAYRFNSNGKSIVAALASFHTNLHTFVIATSAPALFNLPWPKPHCDFLTPGQLVLRIPGANAPTA